MTATFVHAKKTYASLGGSDISLYTNTTEWEDTADDHDLTMYGADSKVFKGGLTTGTVTCGGKYDSTAVTGIRDVIKAKVGDNVTYILRPEGTGTGKPQDSVEVLIKKLKVTLPVADYVAWTAELQFSGDITSTTQV